MKEKRQKGFIREWLEAFLWAFLIVLFLRIFFLEAFTIPSTSMQGALVPGDFIMVSKFHYGARFPVTPFTFPFAHQKIPFTDIKGYSSAIRLPYLRLPGFTDVDRNDVIVFNNPAEKEFPADHRTHFVKRCIGIPGDTIHISHGSVYINNEQLEVPATLLKRFHVKTDTSTFDTSILHEWGITDWQRISNVGDYMIPLPEHYEDSIRLVRGVQSVEISLESPAGHHFLFPYSDNFPWTLDFFGPLYIPAQGDSVELNAKNFRLYKDVILQEGSTVSLAGDTLLIDHKPASSYTFKSNYYFVYG